LRWEDGTREAWVAGHIKGEYSSHSFLIFSLILSSKAVASPILRQPNEDSSLSNSTTNHLVPESEPFNPKMPTLALDTGAELYYETHGLEAGKGHFLLCISGANGNVEPWVPLAKSGPISAKFTTIVYDRRGFSRSMLTGPQDYAHRLDTDADDAAALIKHLAGPEGKAYVLGNSSGAIVSLRLLERHPEVVEKLCPHEPPACKVLPDFEELWETQTKIYNIYRAQGPIAAMGLFFEMTKVPAKDLQAMPAAMGRSSNPYFAGNLTYWFEREVPTYAKSEFDILRLEAEAEKGKLVLLNGIETNPEALQYRGNVELGKLVGLEPVILPGAHMGFMSDTDAFAEKLVEVLEV
jgi:pimeloyl-ACP methyl ester carboxylesterase